MSKAKPKAAVVLDVEDEMPAKVAAPAETKERARQGSDQRPTCEVCGEAMIAASTPPPGIFTWYVCPNRPKGCNGSRKKVPRPQAAKVFAQRRRRAGPKIDDR